MKGNRQEGERRRGRESILPDNRSTIKFISLFNGSKF
jgi:hypothetical protein